MQHQIRALLLFLLSGSACAMFYPRPKDYPRLGKRSFFTTVNGNHYPRIGRRDATGSSLVLPEADYTDLGDLTKRGVFTQGAHGSYPRVGRGGAVLSRDYLNERSKNLEKMSGDKDDDLEVDNGDGSRRLQAGHSGIPLEILFIAYDSDNDGKLSKEEFVTGLAQYQMQCPLY
uniref:HCS2 neuropeptides n=1 Tax=Helix lucorum TaxID=31229 RepID=CNP_HELLU|nr:RecName: Full=HCS2 neuropeptides; AltName: Full=CNP neuropeptides; AltName: Full=Command neuron-specific peptides; Contains: RecName: Full=Peptide CNP1; AltName: Full=CNP1; Contains: RecName: Full=Peptide CNP2; AltName: Full=CNP2; AltName: Full=DYPRLamide; Contains: RecName: Full=Peptide CNP3; AltName: Full=CNP3; Contains: RecName: Full=Peptide CNP4; AltName: Full=CNP4; Flags: Precursor [Helix lucorum]CAA63082.1 neuropeptide precursor [Helix lucorum]